MELPDNVPNSMRTDFRAVVIRNSMRLLVGSLIVFTGGMLILTLAESAILQFLIPGYWANQPDFQRIGLVVLAIADAIACWVLTGKFWKALLYPALLGWFVGLITLGLLFIPGIGRCAAHALVPAAHLLSVVMGASGH